MVILLRKIINIISTNTGKTKFYMPPRWMGYLEIKANTQNSIIGTVIADDYDFCFSQEGIASIEISDERILLYMEGNRFRLCVDIPEDITEIIFPVKFLMEWDIGNF